MSKYGDDYVCTCEMSLVTAKNDLHGNSCELWNEPTFQAGEDEWDGDLGCLVLNRNPWDRPEEYIWNGDTPVVRKATADLRTSDEVNKAVEAWVEIHSGNKDRSEAPLVQIISDLEQEALDELTKGDANPDEFGMVCLSDGSFADFEIRVTYRRVIGDDGGVSWTEMFWDDPINITLDEADEQEMVEDGRPYQCTCTTLKKFYCSLCKVQRDTEDSPWRYWAGHSDVNGGYAKNGSYTSGNMSNHSYRFCTHCFDSFTLPGGQSYDIRISAKRTHGPGTTPDYGLYAYAGWYPECVHTFIPWQDYGLPTVDFAKAARAIVDAWNRAAEGEVVEVGCMGGHGRTGTILACLAILSKPEMSARQAVAHVRSVHCKEAIETNQQVWFVEWFRSHHLGTTCPPKPTAYITKHSETWDAAGKAAVAVKQNVPALPKAQVGPGMTIYPVVGTPTSSQTYIAKWCDHCKRMVNVQHNVGCPTEALEVEEPLTFDPKLMGETANKRRRNAKRANRRAARKQARQMEAQL